MKRIGIDARFYGKAGPGRYTKNIITHLEKIDLENEYFVFLKKEGFDTYFPKNKNFKKILANYNWYSFDEQIRFLFKAIFSKLDLFYTPHFNFPILYLGKIVAAIPDMTMHTFSTEKGTTLPKSYFKLKKLVYRAVFKWLILRAKKIVVPTNTVLDEFIQIFKGISKSKFIVAYEGVDPDLVSLALNNDESVLQKYGIKKPYVLYVGSMYEHKNISGLIEMYKFLKNSFDYTGNLVLICKKDKFSQKIYEDLKEQNLLDKILMPAFNVKSDSDVVVMDEETVSFRKQADVYVCPSFKEGFSLTALEAMSVGLASVISDIPCHREVYGDSVLYFDPKNAQDMAEKVNSVLVDAELKSSLIFKGYGQVKKYSWDNTARITLDIFNNVLKDS